MLLTIGTTHRPATDLGYLLHKHPSRIQRFELAAGIAHVFYPLATEDECVAALLLDIDPISLVRGRRGASEGGLLDQYVNDRPYAANSFLAVAIAEVFGSALNGQSAERPELAATPIPLRAAIPALPSRGGPALLERLFAPLGYALDVVRGPLDPARPEWGPSPYHSVALSGTVRVQDLLRHLYVLIPVLDDDKHYWVGRDEIDKLLKRGEGWLETHPARDLVADRYLRRQRHLTREALARLAVDEVADPDASEVEHAREESAVEEPLRLNEERIAAVVSVLRAAGAKRILDLGCGEGQLIQALLKDPQVTLITGMDVSVRSLEAAARRLRVREMHETQRARLQLLHGSLVYRDARLSGHDAAAVVEVIEHLDPSRLASFERVVFEHARPATVVVTTPNREYNVRFAGLPAGDKRHRDHRFEWTRREFGAWAARVAAERGYGVRYLPVGPSDAAVGPPTQMAVFTR
ncbi:MAG TPA: 3' terminal RNA ribose 2'-O-methyltransferase Hen1 [Candidatus Limnocylindria bacterium]|nr:3' terminal RNA ribose 2'-O-methyltransferase Hen1 [Candidatus Limnocylindria bacterium]